MKSNLKKQNGLWVFVEEKKSMVFRYCSKFWYVMGAMNCRYYAQDTGPGILIKSCTNCFWFEDRQLKYNKL
jgi:hypothetical protein